MRARRKFVVYIRNLIYGPPRPHLISLSREFLRVCLWDDNKDTLKNSALRDFAFKSYACLQRSCRGCKMGHNVKQPSVNASRAPHLLLEQSVLIQILVKRFDSKNRGRASPVRSCSLGSLAASKFFYTLCTTLIFT